MRVESNSRGDRQAAEPPDAWARPSLNHPTITDAPFRYATFSEGLSVEVGERILSWLEQSAPWHLTQTDFYEQHEFSCWDTSAPVAAYLTSADVLETIR